MACRHKRTAWLESVTLAVGAVNLDLGLDVLLPLLPEAKAHQASSQGTGVGLGLGLGGLPELPASPTRAAQSKVDRWLRVLNLLPDKVGLKGLRGLSVLPHMVGLGG